MQKNMKLADDQVRFISDELDINATNLSMMDDGTLDKMINELLFIECDEVEESEAYEKSARYQMVASILSCFERRPEQGKA